MFGVVGDDTFARQWWVQRRSVGKNAGEGTPPLGSDGVLLLLLLLVGGCLLQWDGDGGY